MKRKYSVRIRDYLTKDMIVIVLFILGIISGSMYAIYIKDKDSAVFLMLNNYMSLDTAGTFEMKKFLNSLYGYAKQLLVIWLFGLFYFTLPLSMMALFIMIFSYAFTTTCILLVYGLKGLVAALFIYGIQAILMITVGMYLEIASLRKSSIKMPRGLNECIVEMMPIIAGSCVISLLDMLIMANVHSIVNSIL